jgi:hypothetical protein
MGWKHNFYKGEFEMATPIEIKNKVRSINADNQDICTGKDRCQGYTNNSTSWWISDAGKVLRSQYSGIHTEIGRLMTKISSLENRTSSLSGNVQRAESERLLRAEAQKKKPSSANKKSR